MNKIDLIQKLKDSSFTDNEVQLILDKFEISNDAKDDVAKIEQIGLSAKMFISELAKNLKENLWKTFFDILIIAIFLGTLIVLSCFEFITKESTSTLFALIIGYVLAKFKKGLNM